MGDALLLQILDGRQQLIAEAPHQIERESVPAADPLGKGLLARPLHEDGGAARGDELARGVRKGRFT